MKRFEDLIHEAMVAYEERNGITPTHIIVSKIGYIALKQTSPFKGSRPLNGHILPFHDAKVLVSAELNSFDILCSHHVKDTPRNTNVNT